MAKASKEKKDKKKEKKEKTSAPQGAEGGEEGGDDGDSSSSDDDGECQGQGKGDDACLYVDTYRGMYICGCVVLPRQMVTGRCPKCRSVLFPCPASLPMHVARRTDLAHLHTLHITVAPNMFVTTPPHLFTLQPPMPHPAR